ncbi:MAG: lipopolysaccharide biosynthesis protein [Clostridia bacterium]
MMNYFKKLNGKIKDTEKSAIINMCLKPVSTVLSLIYTPLLLSYLGTEKYGLWATLLSIISWVNYFDVGIGNGLRNLLSKKLSEEKEREAQSAVSTAYIVLSIISCIILLILILLTFTLDWNNIFSTNIDMRPALWISFVFICINFILALSNTILYALQMAERVSIRNCFVQLANILGLLLIRSVTRENLVAMAILFGATSTVVYIGNTIQIIRKKPFLRPRARYFDKTKIKMICNTGIKFFVIQIMCLMLFTVDNLLITHYLGSAAATPFSIANKVFYTAYTFLAAFLVPYWSRTTVALARREISWVKKSIKKVSLLCCLFVIGYFILFLFFKPLVQIWLQKNLLYPKGLILVMFIFYTLYSVLAVECQFINGSGKINIQLIIYLIIGIANIPLSIYLGVYKNLGVVGIRLATTILVLAADIVLGLNLKNIIKRLEKESGLEKNNKLYKGEL